MNLLSLFQKKRPNRDPADEPASPIVILGGQPVRFLSTQAIMTAEVAQRKSPQLYRITNFVASAVQCVPWKVVPDEDYIAVDRAKPTSIKPLNDLLKSPNDNYTAEQMRYWMALNLMLYGRAHFQVGTDAYGTPTGIYPWAAKHVKGVLNAKGNLAKYTYDKGGGTVVTLPTRRTALERGSNEDYAAEISFPTLSGLVEYNKAPAAIESIALPIAIIHALMQRALDTASGHPNIKYVITAEKTLTRQQRDELIKHLEQSAPGEEDSGNVLFLYNTEIRIHELKNDLSDIHSKIPLDDMTRQVAGVFGIPIPLLGLGSADAAKYSANYSESRLSFWQDTIAPSYLSPIAAGMTQALCPPGAKVAFDLDAIPALWDGRAALGQRLTAVNFLTTTEKRKILGFEEDKTLPPIIAVPGAIEKPGKDALDEAPNGAGRGETADGKEVKDAANVVSLKEANGRLQ